MKFSDIELSNLSYLQPEDVKRPGQIPDYSLAVDYDPDFGSNDDKTWNGTNYTVPLGEEFENDDASWIMACTFLVFTMQTGIGLVESGFCSMKNEVNILLKNLIDVGMGGFVFWSFGYGLVHGDHPYSTPYYGVGYYFFAPDPNIIGSGEQYLRFVYNCAMTSFSTSIISGAMAERTALKPFIAFSALNTVAYCFPARWIWGQKGWLKELGVIDNSGCGVVHQMGGFAALVAAYFLGPRLGLHQQHDRVATGNAKNSLMGLFMLWWAFLAFNSGSAFGVTETRWIVASKATVTTICSSFGGGTAGILGCYIFWRGKMKVPFIVNSVFASLVSITGCCFLVTTIEACFIGFLGATLTFMVMMLMERIYWFDDPCATFPVHALSGAWGMIATGLFAKHDIESEHHSGLLHQGGVYLLTVQSLAVLVIAVWSASSTLLILWLLNRVSPIRTSVVNELLGADYSEHNILHAGIGIEKAVDILKAFHDIRTDLDPTGNNLGHKMYLENKFGDGRDGLHDASHQQFQAASDTLSLILGEDVTIVDVKRHVASQRRHVQATRRSEGGSAFYSRHPHHPHS